jgi:uncharacterized protein
MIIDIHTHAFPPEIYNFRDRFFADEPVFKLLYESPKSLLVRGADIVAMMDDQGVDKSVIFGFPWRNIDTCRRNNDYILETVDRHSDRLIGFCCVDPLHREAPAEVERCFREGLAGVGELAFYTTGIDDRCLESLVPVMALAYQFNSPVLIHTNEPVGHQYPGKSPNTLAQIYTLVKRFPKNRIILAHWGGGIFFYALLKKEVREVFAKVWFDTAASPYLYQSQIFSQALAFVGEEKILFGSDFPLLKPQRYFKEMDQAGLSETQKKAICGENAIKVLESLKITK